MKNYWLVFPLFLLLSCNLDDEMFQDQPHGLVGTWKVVETAESSGAEMNVRSVKDGQEITFLANETFVIKPTDNCGSGFYYHVDDRLTLDIFCGNEEEKSQSVIYNVQFEKDYMILVPLSPMCIEGCWYKYKKLNK